MAAVAGLLLVPALLWGIDWLLQMPAPAAPGRLLSGYREFFGSLDEAVTWLWLLSPYLLFLLMRWLFRGTHPSRRQFQFPVTGTPSPPQALGC